MVLAHGIVCNGAYKRLGLLHCHVGREVSGEGSIGRIGQGFGQWLMKFHSLVFFPGLGFSQINICVYVYVLCYWLCLFISLSKLFMFSVNCFTAAVNS